MSKSIELKITQKHINNGTPNYPGSCPVALALIDKGFSRVSVDNQIISYWDQHLQEWCEIYTPFKLFKFINKFDNEEEVKPFKCKLKFKQYND